MMIEKLKKDKAKETIASMDKWIAEIKKAGVDVVEEEDNMKINIPVGTRDTADHFWGNYTEKFLKKYNFLMMSAIILDGKTMLRAIVKTKYGYIAVKYDDYVTYVGNGVWSVSHD